MKREIKGALAGIILILAIGAGRKYVHVQKVYQNEGDIASGFSTQCTNSAWTVIAAADVKRRAVTFQTLTSAVDSVCISTATAGPCVDGTVGFELEAGANLTDYSEARLNCRTRASNVQVKGISYTDSQD